MKKLPVNKTQRLQKWFEEQKRWDNASYGEFMHLGANQTIFRIALQDETITTDSLVLDIACAIGGNARWLASLNGCKVYGIDIDQDALDAANDLAEIEKISHLCEFTKAQADNLPYPDSMFDFIISTDIFDPEEVKRVLKPGGKFLTLVLIDEQDISPSSLAVSWSLKIESEINVTDLALAFHRAKESEAKLLYQANLIDGREMIEIINAGIKPYTKGGQHYMLKLSS